MSASSFKMQPVVAWRALGRLIANPTHTHEVFTIIRALSGPDLIKGLRRFKRTAVGQRILSERRSLLAALNDRDYLASLPANSLGRHYLNFVVSENITADGLADASEEDISYREMDADLGLYATRQRDMHDLWHTLTQYGRDELGEACLLGFTYAQNQNRGIGLIALAGCFKLRPYYGLGATRAIFSAYIDGRRAAWLPAQDWEHLLTLPYAEVRAMLNITDPSRYQSLRTLATA